MNVEESDLILSHDTQYNIGQATQFQVATAPRSEFVDPRGAQTQKAGDLSVRLLFYLVVGDS
ncbi:MAG TPA: hypothetical protein VIW64_10460 [Pyrinomonadaceae bacterium]